VRTRTRAGAVIEGGIRDYQGLQELEDVNFFVRGVDPTAIADVTLVGINIPIRIAGITILPGDVILGTSSGIIVIPPHLAQEVVERSEDVRVRDEFGKGRLATGTYTSGEIDVSPWREDIEADFQDWLATRGQGT
jgi:4-hydroxy-4-methyl-2-oxoglutarate aldolase